MKSLKHFTPIVHVRTLFECSFPPCPRVVTIHNNIDNININAPIISPVSVVLTFVFLDNDLWRSEYWLIDDAVRAVVSRDGGAGRARVSITILWGTHSSWKRTCP